MNPQYKKWAGFQILYLLVLTLLYYRDQVGQKLEQQLQNIHMKA